VPDGATVAEGTEAIPEELAELPAGSPPSATAVADSEEAPLELVLPSEAEIVEPVAESLEAEALSEVELGETDLESIEEPWEPALPSEETVAVEQASEFATPSEAVVEGPVGTVEEDMEGSEPLRTDSVEETEKTAALSDDKQEASPEDSLGAVVPGATLAYSIEESQEPVTTSEEQPGDSPGSGAVVDESPGSAPDSGVPLESDSGSEESVEDPLEGTSEMSTLPAGEVVSPQPAAPEEALEGSLESGSKADASAEDPDGTSQDPAHGAFD
jgi:hypothetical protein